MGVFLVAFAVLNVVVIGFHVALAVGLLRNLRAESRHVGSVPPEKLRPEVIVAVRNEEHSLPRLLESLLGQTRSDCLFLFVDDRSSDATGRILDDFCSKTGTQARVIHNRAEPVSLTGKQAALDLAFGQARGDVLLFTDGDCQLPATWAEELVGHFQEPAIGIVLGRIGLEEGPTFLGRFQSFEQPLLNQYNFGSVGMGVPTGCFGNNMAVRASAVKQIGGFRNLGYSVTEDALLLDAVNRKGGWKVRACTSLRSTATTLPKGTWRDFVNQHTRWNAGGLFSSDLITRCSYTLIVLIYLVGSILVAPLGLLDWRVPILSLGAFFCVGLLAAVGGFSEGVRRGTYFLRFLPYVIFFGFFYSFVTVRAFIRRPFEWKGTEVSPAGPPRGRETPPA
jgi:cellulose synthase/poly-beta-1,6-N-acetylglucosamine synthase-like glycosyltransferase